MHSCQRRLTDAQREEIRRRTVAGENSLTIAAAVGFTRMTVYRVQWSFGFPEALRPRSSCHLRFEEREEISRGLQSGVPLREIARRLGRPPSTISREVRRNGGRTKYRGWMAERQA